MNKLWLLNIVLKVGIAIGWYALTVHYGGPWWFALINAGMAGTLTSISYTES